MTTLIVDVENKTVADFLKKVLHQFKGVMAVDFLNDKAANENSQTGVIEEDLVAYNKAKAEGGPYMTFEDATRELEQAGKL